MQPGEIALFIFLFFIFLIVLYCFYIGHNEYCQRMIYMIDTSKSFDKIAIATTKIADATDKYMSV